MVREALGLNYLVRVRLWWYIVSIGERHILSKVQALTVDTTAAALLASAGACDSIPHVCMTSANTPPVRQGTAPAIDVFKIILWNNPSGRRFPARRPLFPRCGKAPLPYAHIRF